MNTADKHHLILTSNTKQWQHQHSSSSFIFIKQTHHHHIRFHLKVIQRKHPASITRSTCFSLFHKKKHKPPKAQFIISFQKCSVFVCSCLFFASGASFDINYHRSPNCKKATKRRGEKTRENAVQPSYGSSKRCGAPSQDKSHSVLNHQEVVPCIHEWAIQG